MCLQIIYIWYMFKQDLVLNCLRWLICNKTQPKQTNQIMQRKILGNNPMLSNISKRESKKMNSNRFGQEGSNTHHT